MDISKTYNGSSKGYFLTHKYKTWLRKSLTNTLAYFVKTPIFFTKKFFMHITKTSNGASKAYFLTHKYYIRLNLSHTNTVAYSLKCHLLKSILYACCMNVRPMGLLALSFLHINFVTHKHSSLFCQNAIDYNVFEVNWLNFTNTLAYS
jgi:hypothetical protein